MDDKSVRSLNGTRVTDSLLSLVPNRDTFRTALRTYWTDLCCVLWCVWLDCIGVTDSLLSLVPNRSAYVLD